MDTSRGSSKTRDVCLVLGMAFLWPCLIPTTYYPSIEASGAMGHLQTVPVYVIYPIFLVLAIASVFFVRSNGKRSAVNTRMAGFAIGLIGFVGNIILALPNVFDSIPSVAFAFGLFLSAAYVVAFTLLVATSISKGKATRVALLVALSFLVWEFVSALCDIAHIEIWFVLALSPAISTACIMLLPVEHIDCLEKSAAVSGNIPWYMLISSAAFVFFDVIYIKILSVQFPQSSDSLLISMIEFLVIGGVALFFARRRYTNNSVVAVFAALVVLYTAALVVVLLVGHDIAGTNRLWAASGRCFKVFSFLVLACLVSKKDLSPAVAFGFFVLVFFALPNVVSFDRYCQSPLLDWLVHADVAEPLAIVATFATAAVAIVLLVFQTFKLSKSVVDRQDIWQESLCRSALQNHNLTKREMQVAVYVYRGYSAKTTAEALYLSESTVNSHTRSLYRKLQIHSKQELMHMIDDYRN